MPHRLRFSQDFAAHKDVIHFLSLTRPEFSKMQREYDTLVNAIILADEKGIASLQTYADIIGQRQEELREKLSGMIERLYHA